MGLSSTDLCVCVNNNTLNNNLIALCFKMDLKMPQRLLKYIEFINKFN